MKGALKVALIVLMLMFSIASKGQSPLFKCIEINRYVEQNKLQRDSTLYKVLTVWDSYLQLNGAERATSQYWSNEEKEYFGADCDLRYRYIDFSYRKNIEKYYSPTILSVTKIENEFAIKTLFYKINDSDRKVYVTDIINVFVKQEGNKLLLQSALFRNLKLFHKIKMGNINTYSIKNNQLSSSILFKLDSINQAVAKIYRCSPLEIHYFLNNSISDYQHLRGFDYGQTMFISTKEGKSQEGAITEMANKIIFNGNPDPVKYFTHEVAHIYTYHLFSLNNIEGTYHDIIDEGISTFLGGTAGKQIHYLLGSLHSDIVKEKYSYNFSNLSDDSVGVGEENAHLNYVVGGLICKLAYDKAGMDGIFKLLQGGWQDEDLYRTVESVLGVKRENLDSFIRNELKKYAR